MPSVSGQCHDFAAACSQFGTFDRLTAHCEDGHRTAACGASDNAALEVDFKPAVEHKPKWLARRFHIPHVEHWIVAAHRADTRQDGTCPSAKHVAVTACLSTCNPLTLAVFEGTSAIDASGGLKTHPGPLSDHARDKAKIQIARLVLQKTNPDFDTGIAQGLEAVACDHGIGILHGSDHSAYPRLRSALRRKAGSSRNGCRVQASHRRSSHVDLRHASDSRARPSPRRGRCRVAA